MRPLLDDLLLANMSTAGPQRLFVIVSLMQMRLQGRENLVSCPCPQRSLFMPDFQKILIANRGEIAIRVM
ncbi:hypothetical protein, partial [Rubellimicrobium aerolatum]|uniref:hypothetical protein n=1 Tax=Rubellimicrobium aerolatum TaxID=490979 RepID=UPI001AE134C1